MPRALRKTIVTCLAFTALSPQLSFAKDIDVNSEITAATVYSDRATLTRRAVVDIPAGDHTLVFSGLPVSLYPDSLRTTGQASADVTFGAVSHKRTSSADYVVPKEQELNAQLEKLEDQKRVYRVEKQALRTGKTFLDNIGKQAALRENEEIATLDLDPESWGAASDSLTKKVEENLKASLMLDFKIRETDKKITKVRNELNQLRTGQKQSYMVSIPFEADKATTLTVELSYQQPNVGWRPVYDARLDVAGGEMSLVQYGSVWQRTGENWEDVKLTLSTARPHRGAGLPDLHPKWVNILQKRARHNYAAGAAVQALSDGAMTEESVAPAYAKAASPAREVSMQSAQINTEGFVGEYNIAGPATVLSDGTQSKLLIGTFETESAMQVQVKPQYSTEAYLVVTSTLKGEAPILPGQVNLFRDGAFIGKAQLPMLRPGDEEDLSFGVDDNVRVTRNTLLDESSESGLISKDSVVKRHYVTEIKNLHKEPISVAVLETIPVSKDERIRVDVLEGKTTDGYARDVDQIKGLLRWSKDVAPKQDWTVNLGWEVRWPKEENISGL